MEKLASGSNELTDLETLQDKSQVRQNQIHQMIDNWLPKEYQVEHEPEKVVTLYKPKQKVARMNIVSKKTSSKIAKKDIQVQEQSKLEAGRAKKKRYDPLAKYLKK